MGVTDDAIDEYLEKEAKERGEDIGTDVLEENWDAVCVYQHCLWQTRQDLVVTLGGAHTKTRYVGISPQEIEAAARMLKVVDDGTLLGRVRTMVDAAKTHLNKD